MARQRPQWALQGHAMPRHPLVLSGRLISITITIMLLVLSSLLLVLLTCIILYHTISYYIILIIWFDYLTLYHAGRPAAAGRPGA